MSNNTNLYNQSLIAGLLLMALPVARINAQLINPQPYVEGAVADINYLGGMYLNPAGTAMNNGLHNSWYSTAEVHPLGGFHLNIAPSLIIVPEEGQTFEIKNSELTELELVDPDDNITPTAFGPDEEGPLLRYRTFGNTQTFNAPAGVGFSYLPLANLNLGVGLGLNTEVDVRYFPKSKISGLEDARIGLFGIGLMHEVSAWFFDEDPPISVSALLAYSSLSYEQPFDNQNANDHQLEMKSSGITVRAIVSKEFNFLTLYGGVGFNNARANIDLRGTYTYEPTLGSPTTIKDPISTTSETSGIMANLGVRVKIFEAVSIYADYTFAEYSSITAGLGVDLNFK